MTGFWFVVQFKNYEDLDWWSNQNPEGLSFEVDYEYMYVWFTLDLSKL